MRWPKTLWLFVPQAIVLLLQLIPQVGAVLMFVGAPFWAILLLNGPIVALAIEAAFGPGLRRWLILPGLWFGGYLLFVGADRLMTDWSSHRAEIANAGVHASFDPTRQALLIDGYQAGFEMENRAEWFAANTDLPVVYQRNETLKDTPYRALRLVESQHCRSQAAQSRAASSAGVRISALRLPPKPGDRPWDFNVDRNVCVWSAPEVLSLPLTTVKFEQRKNGRGVSATIITPDGRRQVLEGKDEAAAWFPIPLPVLGCGLNDQAGAWQCIFQFMRSPRYSPNKSAEDKTASNLLAARALGLKMITPAQRRPVNTAIVDVQAEWLRDRVARREQARLDQLLAGPVAGGDWVDFSNLAARPDLLVGRLDKAVALIERSAAPAPETESYSRARDVMVLLRQLPADTLKPYRARLESVAARDVNFGLEPKG